MLFIISFFSLLLLNQGCSKKRESKMLEEGQTIPIRFDPDKFSPLDSFISEISVIPLETNDKCLLREHIQNVKIHQGLIYINNMNRELYVFDMKGKFICEIGSRGQVNEGTERNYGAEITLEKFFDKRYYFLLTASRNKEEYIYQYGLFPVGGCRVYF